MKIGAMVDPMGTAQFSPEEEYKEIKRQLCEILELDTAKLTFRTEIWPHQLANERLDIYVFDFGGMLPGCEDTIISHFRELVNQIEQKPNTLFIVWSAYSFNYFYRLALVHEYGSKLEQPNVLNWGDDDLEATEARLRKWFNLPPRVVEPMVATSSDDGF